jgi:phosphate/sulfate permease
MHLSELCRKLPGRRKRFDPPPVLMPVVLGATEQVGIGKTHLTYAQGTCAEITLRRLRPAGFDHSRALVGGPWRSGLQWSTIRNIALAWVLTLPAAMMFSGFLYWTFYQML